MFVSSKTHRTLSDKYHDLWEKYAQQAQLLQDAHQIFTAIPASRLSMTVREQIEQWNKDVAALTGGEQEKGEQA